MVKKNGMVCYPDVARMLILQLVGQGFCQIIQPVIAFNLYILCRLYQKNHLVLRPYLPFFRGLENKMPEAEGIITYTNSPADILQCKFYCHFLHFSIHTYKFNV